MALRSCLWIAAVLRIYICCSFHGYPPLCSHPPHINHCLLNQSNVWVIEDNYTGVIWLNISQNCSCYNNGMCIIATNNTDMKSSLVVQETTDMYTVWLKKKYAARSDLNLTILRGTNCSLSPSVPVMSTKGSCQNTSVNPSSICNDSVSYDLFLCKDKPNDMFIFNITKQMGNLSCITCDSAGVPSKTIQGSTVNSNNGPISSEAAKEAIANVSNLISKMGDALTVAVNMGDVKGILAVIPKNEESVQFALTSDNSLGKPGKGVGTNNDFSGSFTIPKEAIEIARQAMNVVYVGVFLFPSFEPDEHNSEILKKEVYAIEMGVRIYNLSNPIQLRFRNIMGNQTACCSSWEGQGDRPTWTTDGCNTTTDSTTITCSCSHLTFFAILMSPADKSNLTSAELKSLTYITYIGCGMSMFFLGIALFMHFLLRRTKASKSTRILMNLFIAMFLLNFTFLSNEWVANLNNNSSCIFIALATHYFMLSTVTWFAIEAFQLYLQLIKVFNINIRHYMAIVLIVGWALPFVAPLVIVILGNYGNLSISTNDGNTVNMCWIHNATVEYIVNIGYYALVFLFTSSIFITTLQKIVYLKRAKVGNPLQRSITKELFTVIGLCVLLGITWGFAFFSYGPLRIPSYYIFTILNSFQGFFLFLYYYNTAKVTGDKPKLTSTSSASRSTFQNTMHRAKTLK